MPLIDKLGLLHIVDRRLLVARSHGKQRFYVPGGKREAGESDLAALGREILEELGTTLLADSIRPAGIFEAQADGRQDGVRVRLTAYFGTPEGTPAACAEIAELAWFGMADVDRMSLTGQQILRHLQAHDRID